MNSIKSVEIWWDGLLVGRLALTREGLCAFEYSAEQLASGVSISPFELPLRSGVFVAKPRPFDGGFGVFDDCLPDGWGLLVLDRYLQKKGVNPRSLTLLDRLSLVGSPGGARPKIFTRYDGREWLVKFQAKGDPKNIGATEYRYSQLAKECGMEMPETRLFEDKYFGVERFDRTPNGKLHVVSMAGLLCADYRIPSLDYSHIFKVCAALTHSVGEMWKIYRLMCFNYLIGNKDDHAKNFDFIYRDGEWRFAPAFDLLPGDGMNGYHTTSINDSIEPTQADLIAVAANAGLDKDEAETVFEKIEQTIKSNKVSWMR